MRLIWWGLMSGLWKTNLIDWIISQNFIINLESIPPFTISLRLDSENQTSSGIRAREESHQDDKTPPAPAIQEAFSLSDFQETSGAELSSILRLPRYCGYPTQRKTPSRTCSTLKTGNDDESLSRLSMRTQVCEQAHVLSAAPRDPELIKPSPHSTTVLGSRRFCLFCLQIEECLFSSSFRVGGCACLALHWLGRIDSISFTNSVHFVRTSSSIRVRMSFWSTRAAAELLDKPDRALSLPSKLEPLMRGMALAGVSLCACKIRRQQVKYQNIGRKHGEK